MKRALLDVNVLLAMLGDHVDHDPPHVEHVAAL